MVQNQHCMSIIQNMAKVAGIKVDNEDSISDEPIANF